MDTPARSRGTCRLTINNCYSTGNIGNNTGGICGRSSGETIDNGQTSITIDNCYVVHNSSTSVELFFIGSNSFSSNININNVIANITWNDDNANLYY